MNRPMLHVGGYKVKVMPKITIKPAWYDLVRRLGFLPPKMVSPLQPGETFVSPYEKTVFVRDDDIDGLTRHMLNPGPRARIQVDNVTDLCHRLRIPPPGKL